MTRSYLSAPWRAATDSPAVPPPDAGLRFGGPPDVSHPQGIPHRPGLRRPWAPKRRRRSVPASRLAALALPLAATIGMSTAPATAAPLAYQSETRDAPPTQQKPGEPVPQLPAAAPKYSLSAGGLRVRTYGYGTWSSAAHAAGTSPGVDRRTDMFPFGDNMILRPSSIDQIIEPGPGPTPPSTYLGTFLVTCYDLTGATASGALAGPQSVAVDPRVIPLGTEVFVAGVGDRTADDTGGAIIGNHIDIWESTYTACADWGVQDRAVFRIRS